MGNSFALLTLILIRTYKIAIQALTSRIEYGDSKLSNIIHVNTYSVNNDHFNQDILKISANRILKHETVDLENLDSALIQIRDFYNHENLKDNGHESNIPLKIAKIGEDNIDIDWSNFVIDSKIDSFKIEWHCWNTDKRENENINSNILKFNIKRCYPGNIYSVRVLAYQNDNIINKSKFIIVQTNAPPDTPKLKLRYNFHLQPFLFTIFKHN